MKQLAIILSLLLITFTACEKDQEMVKVLPTEQVKAPVLAAHNMITVNKSNYSDNTVFTWQTADFGAPTTTEYSLYAALDGKEPALITSAFGDSLSVSLLVISKVLYQSGIRLDYPVDVKFHIVASINSTYGTVQSAPITVNVTVGSDVPLYPDAIYMIGQDFGSWDWNNSGVVEMTPVHSHDGQFWCVRYFRVGQGFKWCTVKDWKGDFYSLGTDAGFTTADGNAFVPADGFYSVYVDYTTNTITIEPAQVFGMGDCFGGWNTGQYPFTANGTVMKITTTATGELRIYATSSAAQGVDWWQMEFVILNDEIEYRGKGDDQTRVSVDAGKTITLDFNAGTGKIE
ncbi:MAG: SusF/SusE family outer membrane protein [Prevotellaceae bacterium]|jgi:hypothetical protein|nr:SusF/SusE family outer membrane protein [Prevotellaceae bacterium]